MGAIPGVGEELRMLVERENALEQDCVDLFNQHWKPRFTKANTEEEFLEVQHELFSQVGGNNALPSAINLELIYARDAFRQRMKPKD